MKQQSHQNPYTNNSIRVILVIVVFLVLGATFQTDAAMKILAPLPDEFIRFDEFLVAVTLPPGSEKLRLFLDKKELPRPQHTSSTVTFIPDDSFFKDTTMEGPHRLTIKRYAGYSELIEERTLIIYLVADDSLSARKRAAMLKQGKVLAQEEASKTIISFHNGRISSWFENEAYLDTNITVAEVNAWGNGGYGDLKYDYNFTLRTDEQSQYQSLQRFRGALAYRSIARLSGGDNWPAYHRSILQQQRVRGIELNLKTPNDLVGLDFVWGQSQRSIKPFAVNQSLLSLAETHNDSISAFSPGTYARDLKALRLGVNIPHLFNAAITVCKAIDDTSSIEQLFRVDSTIDDSIISGRTPMDNFVYGADAELKLLKGTTNFYGSFAMSWLTEDISIGSLPKEELDDYFNPDAVFVTRKNISRLLTINETTVPLPIPSDTTQSLNVGSLFSSMNWDAGLKLNIPFAGTNSRADVKYYYIGPNYHSLGNPYLTVDRAGWLFNAQSHFLNGKLFVNGKLNLFNKDLFTFSATPTKAVHSTVSTQIALHNKLPTLTLHYSVNDEQSRTSAAEDPDLKNNFYTLGGSLLYAPRFGIVTPSFSVSYYNSKTRIYSDNLSEPFRMRSHSLVTSVNVPIDNSRFEPCASFSLHATTEDVPLTMTSLSAGTRWHVIPKTFITDFLLGFTGSKDPNAPDLNDFTFKTGGRFEISKRNTLWLNAGLKWSYENEKMDSRFKFNYELRY